VNAERLDLRREFELPFVITVLNPVLVYDLSQD
jgi:hypothetical protein